jgi:hypothetical protein
MTILSSLWDWVKKTAALLPVVFGVVYGVIQYERSKLDGQIKQTLSLYDKFNSSPFTNYREKISDAMEEMLASRKSNETSDSFTSIVRKIVKEENVKRSLNMMLDFFDGLTACIDNEICDSDSAKQLFQARANEIYVNFYPHIKDIRNVNQSDEYGQGLFHIARHIEESSSAFKWYRKIITY